MTVSEPVLSEQDLTFFADNGYVVARQVIIPDQALRTARAVWDFAGMDPVDPDTWYSNPPRSIMIEIYHHQTMWDNRTCRRVHEAFSQIWKTERLWVSHDRASINPPSRDPNARQHNLHWDITLDRRPVEYGVQGVLYLTDTPAHQGAFTCVPGFHKRIENWLDDLEPDADPTKQDLLALGPRSIGASAGDLIIWHKALPHRAGLNRGTGPRVAQYITMSPAADASAEKLQRRIAFWRDRLTGLGRFQKQREHNESSSADLTPLGRKLAGVDPWPLRPSIRAPVCRRE